MKYVFKKFRYRLGAAALDLFGNIIYFKKKKPWPKKADFKKILVIRLDHLGDILLCSHLPRRLKEYMPGAAIHFLTNSLGESVFRENAYIDRLWLFDAPWFSGKNHHSGMKLRDLVKKLRREKYDLVLSLRGDMRENWLAHALRPKYSLGYGITGGGFWLTRALSHDSDAHETEHTAKILRTLGIESGVSNPEIYFGQKEIEQCRAMFSAMGLGVKNYAVFQLDAGTSSKEWPLENFQNVLDLVEQQFPSTKIVFVGRDTARASWLTAELQRRGPRPWIHLVGRTKLRELFFLLRDAKLFVGADSGPGHAAASFGVPTLFLYSGTNEWKMWKSLSENAFFLRQEVPCSPCHMVQCPVSGHPCMSRIRPGDVVSWMKERWHGA